MFCENCGKQIEDNATFCEHCGAKQENAPVAAPAAPKAAPAFVTAVKTKVAAIHKKNKWILPACAAALVVVIVAIVLIVNIASQVPMENYVKVEVSGFEGYSYFDCDLDRETMFLRVMGEEDCKEYGDSEYLGISAEEYLMKFFNDVGSKKTFVRLVESVDVTYEFPEGKNAYNLCNGDEVKITLACDEDAAKELGVALKGGTFTYTVTGLKAVETIDVLEYFDVTYEGATDYARAYLTCTKSETVTKAGVTFFFTEGERYFEYARDEYRNTIYPELYAENNGYLKNGSTISISLPYQEDYFADEGLLFASVKKDITVAGLQEPVEFDLLQYVKPVYTGINGNGRLKLEATEQEVTFGDYRFDIENGYCYYKDERICYFYFNYSRSYSLSNGDTITITISCDEEDLARKGLKLKATTMDATVAGLHEYVTKLSQLSSVMSSYETAAKETIMNYLNEDWSIAVHNSYFGSYSNQTIGDDLTLYKTILTTHKSSNSASDNALWLIYSVTISDNKITTPTTYYFAVRDTSIAVSPADNTLYEEIRLNKYRGYTSYEDLYKAYIESYNLNIEVSPE